MLSQTPLPNEIVPIDGYLTRLRMVKSWFREPKLEAYSEELH